MAGAHGDVVWTRHPELAERVEGIIATLDDDPDEVDLSDDIATFRAAAGRSAPS